jgi:hypothetical protein
MVFQLLRACKYNHSSALFNLSEYSSPNRMRIIHQPAETCVLHGIDILHLELLLPLDVRPLLVNVLYGCDTLARHLARHILRACEDP